MKRMRPDESDHAKSKLFMAGIIIGILAIWQGVKWLISRF